MKRNILLNPGPATTTDTVKNSLLVPDICPREKEFGELMKRVMKKLVDVIHGGPEYTSVIFTGSGTAAIEACITSVVPHDKKIFIINNGAYGKRMVQIAKINKIDCIHYEEAVNKEINLNSIESFLKQNKREISHLAIVHHETTTGMLNPVNEICKISNSFGIECIVDAMSSYAGIPINIKEMNADFLISSSNKCIQGMAGLSFVISRVSSLDKLNNIPPRSLYLDLLGQFQSLKKTNQMRFTPAVQIFYALEQALNEYFEETAIRRYERYKNSYDVLIRGLKDLGFKLYLPDHLHSKLLTTIYEPTNSAYSFNEMHDYLYEKGYTIYPGKCNNENTFRIANIGQIDQTDIIGFIEKLEAYLIKYGIIGALYA